MEGGLSRDSVDRRGGTGATSRIARFVSRHTIIAAFIAVIATVFHVTGSTGPHATANQSVLVLAIVLAQINMPRRHLQGLIAAPSRALRPASFDPATQE